MEKSTKLCILTSILIFCYRIANSRWFNKILMWIYVVAYLTKKELHTLPALLECLLQSFLDDGECWDGFSFSLLQFEVLSSFFLVKKEEDFFIPLKINEYHYFVRLDLLSDGRISKYLNSWSFLLVDIVFENFCFFTWFIEAYEFPSLLIYLNMHLSKCIMFSLLGAWMLVTNVGESSLLSL